MTERADQKYESLAKNLTAAQKEANGILDTMFPSAEAGVADPDAVMDWQRGRDKILELVGLIETTTEISRAQALEPYPDSTPEENRKTARDHLAERILLAYAGNPAIMPPATRVQAERASLMIITFADSFLDRLDGKVGDPDPKPLVIPG